jgi:hypothetical protein
MQIEQAELYFQQGEPSLSLPAVQVAPRYVATRTDKEQVMCAIPRQQPPNSPENVALSVGARGGKPTTAKEYSTNVERTVCNCRRNGRDHHTEPGGLRP